MDRLGLLCFAAARLANLGIQRPFGRGARRGVVWRLAPVLFRGRRGEKRKSTCQMIASPWTPGGRGTEEDVPGPLHLSKAVPLRCSESYHSLSSSLLPLTSPFPSPSLLTISCVSSVRKRCQSGAPSQRVWSRVRSVSSRPPLSVLSKLVRRQGP